MPKATGVLSETAVAEQRALKATHLILYVDLGYPAVFPANGSSVQEVCQVYKGIVFPTAGELGGDGAVVTAVPEAQVVSVVP